MTAKSLLANHTIEGFRAQAGIKERAVELVIDDEFFLVKTLSGKTYEARFLRNGTPVEQFLCNDTKNFLNHEEARDLMMMVRQFIPASDYIAVLNRLESNLPSLRVGETPIMAYKASQPAAQNAKNWAWELNNE